MAKNRFLREKGRLRHQEKSFNVTLGGDGSSIECAHGWYRDQKIGATVHRMCVLCGVPEAACEQDLERRRRRDTTFRSSKEE